LDFFLFSRGPFHVFLVKTRMEDLALQVSADHVEGIPIKGLPAAGKDAVHRLIPCNVVGAVVMLDVDGFGALSGTKEPARC
jgi:hypothetical protein